MFMEKNMTRGLQGDEEGIAEIEKDARVDEEHEDESEEPEEPEEPEYLQIDETQEISVESTETNKPVMHTFYESVKQGCCGMTAEGHEALLNAWKNSWEERGWETKILTMEDAKKHPDYEMLDERLSFLQVTPYNKRCFWRWLAMASLDNEDGGWMSDYDVFPLELDAEKANELTVDGKFRSYALHIPCLIHASRAEWDRVIHLMIDVLPEERGTFVTDMLTLQNVDFELGRSKMEWTLDVASNFLYSLDENNERYLDCGKGERKLAVHLSHFGCSEAWKDGFYPLTDGIENAEGAVESRADAAAYMMNDYKDGCILSVE